MTKLLRFAWDHPGMTALVAVAALACAPMAVAHPFMVAAAALITFLSWRKTRQTLDAIAEIERRVAETSVALLQEEYDASKRRKTAMLLELDRSIAGLARDQMMPAADKLREWAARPENSARAITPDELAAYRRKIAELLAPTSSPAPI